MPFQMHITKVVETYIESQFQIRMNLNDRLIIIVGEGCSALTISGCNSLLVSGGIEGQIRVWKINSNQQSLSAVLKEHTAPVASLQFNCFDREIVSSSSDGTCIIWDIG